VDEHLEISVVGASVPLVGDVAALHDLSEELAQVVPWDVLVAVELVGEDVAADGEVAVVEGLHA